MFRLSPGRTGVRRFGWLPTGSRPIHRPPPLTIGDWTPPDEQSRRPEEVHPVPAWSRPRPATHRGGAPRRNQERRWGDPPRAAATDSLARSGRLRSPTTALSCEGLPHLTETNTIACRPAGFGRAPGTFAPQIHDRWRKGLRYRMKQKPWRTRGGWRGCCRLFRSNINEQGFRIGNFHV